MLDEEIMAVYFFAAIDRRDFDAYSRYEAAGFSSIEKYGVEVLESATNRRRSRPIHPASVSSC